MYNNEHHVTPLMPKEVFAMHQSNMANYYETNPDTQLKAFEQEVRQLGFVFDVPTQILQFLPKHKKKILPIAMKYYTQSNQTNEKNFYLGLFRFKGFDEVVPMLLQEFTSVDTGNLTRWLIADCLYTISAKNYLCDYLQIAKSTQYGINRQMIVLLLGKLRSEVAIPKLIDLLEDRDVCLQAITALGNYKNESFRYIFERFQSSSNTALRKSACAALKKLNC